MSAIRGFRRPRRRLPSGVRQIERLGFGGRTPRPACFGSERARVPGHDEFFSRAVFAVRRRDT